MEVLPTLEKEFVIRGEPFVVTIHPARLQDRDKDGKIVREYEVYPGRREELIEDALRKLACTRSRAVMLDQQVGLVFTIYELREELKKMGHTFNHPQIKEDLLTLRKAIVEINGKSRKGKALVAESIISSFGAANFDDWKEGGKKAKCYVKFSALVSRAIVKNRYRLFNYDICMSYKSDFARCLHKRLALNFTQASREIAYRVKLSSLIRDAGFTMGKRPGQTHLKVASPAFAEMKKKGVLDRYTEEVVYDPENKQRILDYRYELFVSESFVKDQIRANSFFIEEA
jgi:hypothetical protein